MLCHHYKCIFVHIPKNAGQSVEHVFLDLMGLTWETRAPLLLRPKVPGELGPPRLAHLIASDYIRLKYVTPEMFESYYKFAFVRNPWSRMVSFYKYLGYNKKTSFDDFVLKEFKENIFAKNFWFVRPQVNYVSSKEGDPLVDFVGKFENLQADFDQVCQEINLPKTTLPHVNKSQKSASNTSGSTSIKRNQTAIGQNKKPYQDYYSPASVDFVAELYQADIEAFDYKFEPK